MKKVKNNSTKKEKIVVKEMVKSVGVRFHGTPCQTYWYKTNIDFKEGDTCVVDAPSTGYTCVKVVHVNDRVDPKATKWVVSAVNDTDYQNRKAKAVRMSEIRQKMAGLKQKVDEKQIMRIYAQQSSEFADLLKELEALENS